MTTDEAKPLTRDYLDAKLGKVRASLGEFKVDFKLWYLQCVVIHTVIILAAIAWMLDHVNP